MERVSLNSAMASPPSHPAKRVKETAHQHCFSAEVPAQVSPHRTPQPGRLAASLLVLELVRQPVQALVQPIAASSTRGLDVPVTVAQRVKAQLVSDLSGIHGIGQVL